MAIPSATMAIASATLLSTEAITSAQWPTICHIYNITNWHNICHNPKHNICLYNTMVITSATAMWLPFTRVSIKLQDTPTFIHHQVFKFIKVNIFLRSEEAMF